jgi:hypothetical protein
MEHGGVLLSGGENCAGSGKKNFAHMGLGDKRSVGADSGKLLVFPAIWSGKGIARKYKLV